jgi:4-hydroxymandelate oxidase
MELIRRFEEVARERLPEPVYEYYAGGAGEEQTIAENLEAWRRVWLRPRGLVDVQEIDLAVELLGDRMAMPLLLAPMGQQGQMHPDGEVAVARAAGAAGVVQCLSTRSSSSREEVAAEAGAPQWFQLYVHEDRAAAEALLRSLAPLGFRRVVVTIDLAVVGRRDRERRHYPKDRLGNWAPWLTWDELDWVREASGLPVVVKGVSTAEDAREAVTRGAEAVIVSNHGGRQLDGAVPTAVALREVVAELGGAVPVLVDGGIRSGADVCRALALGASAALVGRPFAWALAAGGEEGVGEPLGAFEEDLRITLALLGKRSPLEVDGACARLAGW